MLQDLSKLRLFVKPVEPLAETLKNVCRGLERSAELASYDDLRSEYSAEEEGQEVREEHLVEDTEYVSAEGNLQSSSQPVDMGQCEGLLHLYNVTYLLLMVIYEVQVLKQFSFSFMYRLTNM